MLASGREAAGLEDGSVSGLGGSPEDGQLASSGSALGISGKERGLEGGDFLEGGGGGVGGGGGGGGGGRGGGGRAGAWRSSAGEGREGKGRTTLRE